MHTTIVHVRSPLEQNQISEKSQFEPHGSHVIRYSSKTQPHILDLELERILRNRIRQHIITAGSG